MSKAVLISIRPEWCVRIASGEKTIEVRKTRPNLEVPFKCYIYCTKSEPTVLVKPAQRIGNGLVIGEFVCDRVIRIQLTDEGYDFDVPKMTGLTYEEMDAYLNRKNGYGWHITELKIYDQPKPLSVFRKPIEALLGWNGELKRPPQSWCYVEELT